MTQTRPLLMIPLMIPGLLLGLALVGASQAYAQCNLQVEIERADFLIDRARELVATSAVPEAVELLRSAEIRRNEAEKRARNRERERACLLARVAQQLAQKAAEIARRGTQGVERLEEMLRRTDDFLEDSSTAVMEAGSPEARKMIGAANRQQRKAWGAFRDSRPRQALKLTLMARETARRAARQAHGVDGGDAELVERELRGTDRVIQEAQRVMERGEGRESLPLVLKQAQRLQAQAWIQLRAQHPGLAYRLTRQVRQMVSRGLGTGDVAPLRREIQAMIGTTAELIDRLLVDAATAGQEQAIRRLGHAENLLENARASFARGELRSAAGSVRAASALAWMFPRRWSTAERNK